MVVEKLTKEYIQSLNENKLRTEVIIPLFRAMRFTVHENHGAQEFGKDLILYHRDNMGEIVYSAVQIKTKDIHGTIDNPKNVRTVIQQCELSFEIPFSNAFELGAPNKRIERVYVVTSGKITSGARIIITNAIRKYGPVKFMDIDRLLAFTNDWLPVDDSETNEDDDRPEVTPSLTTKVLTGCGHLYLSYSTSRKSKQFLQARLGKAGGCASAQLDALCSMINLALNNGASIHEVIRKLKGVRCPSIVLDKVDPVLSCADAISLALQEVVGINT